MITEVLSIYETRCLKKFPKQLETHIMSTRKGIVLIKIIVSRGLLAVTPKTWPNNDKILYHVRSSSSRANLLYSEAMEIKSHPVGVYSVEACGSSGGRANSKNIVVVISLYIYEVGEARGGRDFSRSDL